MILRDGTDTEDLAIARSKVRQYVCPECNAQPGDHCVGARGKVRESNHKERLEVARRAMAGMNGRRKVTLEDDGYLVLSDGTVLGRLVSLSIDFDDRDRGGVGEEAGVGTSSSSKSSPSKDGGLEETNGKSIVAEQIRTVWAFYVQTMKPRRTELDPQTAAVIRDALKVANSEECIGAIRGCSKSSHHMGDNDRNKKYNSISHILRGKRGIRTTREQIDLMLTYDDERDSAALPSGVSAEILTAKRTIRQYAPFTANSHAQQLATAAMDKLIRYDITTRILKAENGTVREIVFSDERQAA